jgi:uncharacterized membrane protein
MWFDVVVNFLHIVATVAWIGGMFFMKAVLMPAQEAIDPPQRGRLMGAVAPRFTAVAWTSVVVLIITGLLKTPEGWFMNFGTIASTTLAVKHLLFLGMIVIGLVITFRYVPKMKSLAPAPGDPPSKEFVTAQSRIEALSAINGTLGLLVLLAVALMNS